MHRRFLCKRDGLLSFGVYLPSCQCLYSTPARVVYIVHVCANCSTRKGDKKKNSRKYIVSFGTIYVNIMTISIYIYLYIYIHTHIYIYEADMCATVAPEFLQACIRVRALARGLMLLPGIGLQGQSVLRNHGCMQT